MSGWRAGERDTAAGTCKRGRRMSLVGANRARMLASGALAVSMAVVLAGCQGSASPIEELADLSTTVKFDSQTFGVPASPRVTNLRQVPKGGGRAQVGKPYKVRGKWYYPKDDPGYVETGTASWYGPNFHGRLTANGEVYDMHGLSAAHKTFPLPSYAMVTNLDNGAKVMVRVNDRGPFADDREIDVSAEAADLLGFKDAGTADVKVEYVGRAPLERDDTQMLMASYVPGEGQAQPQSAPDSVMVASAGPLDKVGRSLMSLFGDTGKDLPDARSTESVPAANGALAYDVPVPSSRALVASFAQQRRAPAGGAVAAVTAAATAAGEPRRIAIGTTDPAVFKRVRAVATGAGRLVEDEAPDGQGVAATLVLNAGIDADGVLRRLWQVGADEAFVVRD